jgi:uncharacterized protein
MMAKQDVASDERTIQVIGRGTANTVPDVAVVQLGVRTTAPTAQAASQSAAAALNAMLDVLRGNGVEDRHIQTGYVNLSPEYQHGPEGAKRIGHSATNTVQVRVTPLAKTGAILDAIVVAGGDLVTINGVQLEASDTKPARTEAQRLALLDARAQAEHMASVLGVGVGAVLYIGQGESVRPVPVRGPRMREMFAEAAPTPIEAGELTISAQVEVIFALT